MAQLPGVALDGRTALVTGAGRGIGRTIAALLASAGCEVLAADLDGEDLERTATRLSVATQACDFSQPEQIEELFAEAGRQLGRLDILVCAHARRPPPNSPVASPDATLLCIQQAGKAMAAGGAGGRIVVIGSAGGLASGESAAAHDAAQAGIPGLIKAAAVELGPERITVNMIVTGWIRSEMTEDELESISELSLGPVGMIGEPEDVARAALWLIDPENGYVSGATIVVDGGRAATLPPP
jgi:NAD(P)-dependent dehydrogenase (short-subunit alcohol dehydrogenase family)